MGILDFLGITGTTERGDQETSEVGSIRRISKQLDEMPKNEARYIAAFAYLLGRVAHADLEISETEGRKMEGLIMEKTGLPQNHAVMIVEMAKRQNQLFGHVENFLVTREFNQLADHRQKMDLLDCLFAVCAAEDSVSATEDREIRQIASELLLDHSDFIQVRSRYRDDLEIFKKKDE